MKNHPELLPSVITVMTSRDAQKIFEVMRESCGGRRRHLPPGVGDVEDLNAIMRGGVAFFLAYIDDQPVGVLGYRWERAALRIFHVAVKEQYQRIGVARRLVQALESVGFALGTTSVTGEVSAEGMHLPFERLGYSAEPPGSASRCTRRCASERCRYQVFERASQLGGPLSFCKRASEGVYWGPSFRRFARAHPSHDRHRPRHRLRAGDGGGPLPQEEMTVTADQTFAGFCIASRRTSASRRMPSWMLVSEAFE